MSAELLTCLSTKTSSSIRIFKAWGYDGKIHIILGEKNVPQSWHQLESLTVLAFIDFRWYVRTYQCLRIASARLSLPVVSVVVVALTRRSVPMIIHSVLICENLYGLDARCLISWYGQWYFFSLLELVWGRSSLLSSWYWGLFPRG
jgi:hypothetical protein